MCFRTGWPFRGDLERQDWAKRDLRTISKESPAQGSKPLQWYRLETDHLGSSSTIKRCVGPGGQ